MSYNYRFIPASMSIRPRSGTSPKNVYTELFEETVRDQFYNSSNWWTIQEETSIGSKVYENTDVRISHVINAETGLKLGDDWKTLFFPEITHPVKLGKHYIFDSNTWLTINTEVIKNLSATCTIRRCNNTLRWIDESTGIYYTEPCCIEYLVKEPRDYFTQGSVFTTPGGFLHIEMQFNDRSKKINENQRFLFGNPEHWSCYKVIGMGINDFRNSETYNNESAQILTLDLIANFVNKELDDVVNGIADVYTNLYNITLSKETASGSSTSTVQLYANVIYNGDSVTRGITWATSAPSIATVSGSGLVTLISNGSCIITAGIENNPVSGSCLITVTNTPSVDNEIRIIPNINYILEGSQRTYSVYLYKDDVVQGDSFVITCNGSSVPSTSYNFVQTDGNHFTITNILRDVSSYLVVQCTSGSIISPKTAKYYLRGAWLNDNI